MMKKLNLIIIFILVWVNFVSCKKDFLNEDPLAIIAPDNLYVDKAGFEAGLHGLYNLVRKERSGINASANEILNSAAMIGVDNAYSISPGTTADRTFNDFDIRLNSTNNFVRILWAHLYTTINAANTLIDRSLNPSIPWTEAEKKQIIGEARLIRALAYRHLTYLWGDVPVTTNESSGKNIQTDWERSPVGDVRKVIEDDLLFAEANMGDEPVLEGRASSMVAAHYLTELYLTTNEYQKAKDKALTVINNSKYKIITDRYGSKANQRGTPFTDMFLDKNSNRSEGNREALWVFQNEYLSLGGIQNIMRRWWVNRYHLVNVSTKTNGQWIAQATGSTPITASIENGGRGLGRFAVTKFALSLYESTDDRGSDLAWRYYYLMNNPASIPAGGKIGDTVRLVIGAAEPLPSSSNAPQWPSIRKWDYAPDDINDVSNTSNYNDQVYLRLAETYLLLAEAQFRLNDLDGAAQSINVLRNRAHASPVKPSAITLDYILDERSRELITEEHRRYVLVRTGKWLERTRLYNKYASTRITERDLLLPIPQSVIDANLTKEFPQNQGY